MRFYFMEVDEYGIMCVDQVDPLEDPKDIAILAKAYPEVIYFVVYAKPDDTEGWWDE